MANTIHKNIVLPLVLCGWQLLIFQTGLPPSGTSASKFAALFVRWFNVRYYQFPKDSTGFSQQPYAWLIHHSHVFNGHRWAHKYPLARWSVRRVVSCKETKSKLSLVPVHSSIKFFFAKSTRYSPTTRNFTKMWAMCLRWWKWCSYLVPPLILLHSFFVKSALNTKSNQFSPQGRTAFWIQTRFESSAIHALESFRQDDEDLRIKMCTW